MTENADHQPIGDNILPKPPNALEPAPGVWIDEANIVITFSRSSGPGGQCVNKLSTRAQLRVSLESVHGLSERAELKLRRIAGQRLTKDDELLIQCDTHRSQRMNRDEAMNRLEELLTEATRLPKRRKRTKPSRAVKRRRLEAKRKHGEKKRRRNWRPD